VGTVGGTAAVELLVVAVKGGIIVEGKFPTHLCVDFAIYIMKISMYNTIEKDSA
jgi:hypothetical protein